MAKHVVTDENIRNYVIIYCKIQFYFELNSFKSNLNLTEEVKFCATSFLNDP